jgi:EPS-associated MarR family transcriptional regulator
MASRKSKQQEDTYFKILQILNKQPDITQRELAEKIGFSVSGMHYCLKALIEKGLVKMQNFSKSNKKLGYMYLLTPKGVSEKAALTTNFLRRRMQEYESLQEEIQSMMIEMKAAGFNSDFLENKSRNDS